MGEERVRGIGKEERVCRMISLYITSQVTMTKKYLIDLVF